LVVAACDQCTRLLDTFNGVDIAGFTQQAQTRVGAGVAERMQRGNSTPRYGPPLAKRASARCRCRRWARTFVRLPAGAQRRPGRSPPGNGGMLCAGAAVHRAARARAGNRHASGRTNCGSILVDRVVGQHLRPVARRIVVLPAAARLADAQGIVGRAVQIRLPAIRRLSSTRDGRRQLQSNGGTQGPSRLIVLPPAGEARRVVEECC